MKKQLLTAVILLSFVPFLKAQRGVGINTSTPASTLDVSATTTDNTLGDAILAPRMTLAQLVAKDNTANTYGANQNGALIYVTDDSVGSGSRRAKITGHGFYYFDNTVPEWKPFGGSSTTTATPTYRTVPGATLTTLLPTDVGNVVIFSGGISGDVKFPTPDASMIGKKLTLIEVSGISQLLANVNPNYKTVTLGSLQQYGSEFITDGTNWYALGGQ